MSFEILKKHLQKERALQKIKVTATKPVQVEVPLGLYEDCPFCQRKLNKETLEKNFFVCHHCEKPLRLRSIDRINMTVDAGSFIEKGKGYITLNPFFDKTYDDKIIENKNKTQLEDAFVYGSARIDAEPCVIGV
jgi:acetyl-CoA carboxylase carboxyl transferase subunit beta